jgi:SAM-dependent methyltransferase
VGAGPLTVLGKQWKGRTLDLHAVDPLADEYDTLLDEFNITPIVRTELCDGERLTEKYNESTFDIVYACNCLDHSYSPLDCFKQMVKVVKPGGYVITDHLVNEGKHQGYKDIHQWNFCTRKSLFGKPERFYIRRPGCMIDLQKALRDTARVTAKTVPGSAQYPAPHVMTWIKKL